LAATGMIPESRKAVESVDKFEHGRANDDWVREWAFERKVKAMVSPTLTLSSSDGVKVREALAPTRTLNVVCAATEVAVAKATATVEKRMFERGVV